MNDFVVDISFKIWYIDGDGFGNPDRQLGQGLVVFFGFVSLVYCGVLNSIF